MATQPQVTREQELALLEKARGGDHDALGSLIQPWRKPLIGYIYRMVTHRQDAEDLLQDVLVRVLQNIHDYRGEAPFKVGYSASPLMFASTTCATRSVGAWRLRRLVKMRPMPIRKPCRD